jgi:hypothetical protein
MMGALVELQANEYRTASMQTPSVHRNHATNASEYIRRHVVKIEDATSLGGGGKHTGFFYGQAFAEGTSVAVAFGESLRGSFW